MRRPFTRGKFVQNAAKEVDRKTSLETDKVYAQRHDFITSRLASLTYRLTGVTWTFRLLSLWQHAVHRPFLGQVVDTKDDGVIIGRILGGDSSRMRCFVAILHRQRNKSSRFPRTFP